MDVDDEERLRLLEAHRDAVLVRDDATAELADLLPRYRARTLTIDEMIERLQARIAAVDAAIAEQQALRARLVDHVAWFEGRKRQAAPSPPSVFQRQRRSR